MRLSFRRRPQKALKLVVGLGNPGKRYESSRHNVGFMVADAWANRHGILISRKRAWAFMGEADAEVDGSSVHVLVAKPRTFMNASGESVGEMVHRHHVKPEDVVVVYDEMDLPLGRIRVREKGSAGGHKGMGSIIGLLNTDGIPRLRIGIGRPGMAIPDAIGHVLGDFEPDEAEAVTQAVDRACDAIDEMLARGPQAAMNRFNAA